MKNRADNSTEIDTLRMARHHSHRKPVSIWRFDCALPAACMDSHNIEFDSKH